MFSPSPSPSSSDNPALASSTKQPALSAAELRAFANLGVIVLKPKPQTVQSSSSSSSLHGRVPAEVVAAALASKQVKEAIDECPEDGWHSGGYDEGETTLRSLFEYARPAIEQLVGAPVGRAPNAQVAVRKPAGPEGDGDGWTLEPGEVGPDVHIDGLHVPGNGVPYGVVQNFTLLVGIALTDLPNPNMGNFAYVPCSHTEVGLACSRVGGGDAAAAALSTADGERPIKDVLGDLGISFEDLPPALPVCCRAGTIYLAHYSTLHFVQPCARGSPTRVAVYFRITTPKRPRPNREEEPPNSRHECLTREGMFLELPGLGE